MTGEGQEELDVCRYHHFQTLIQFLKVNKYKMVQISSAPIKWSLQELVMLD